MIRLVVLGDPVSHSRSPAMHTAALSASGISGEYLARRVDDDGMQAAAREMRHGVLTGANITTPHKHLAANLADRRSDLVRRMGAANTWWIDQDALLVAENTDVAGVEYAFEQVGVSAPTLILGAGGAAAAALVAVAESPRADHAVYLSTRNEDRARVLLDRLGLSARFVAWETPISGAVVVNATRLGMAGETLPPGLLEEAAGLVDMPYGDRPTPAVARALQLGIPCSPGLDMLLGQAVAAFTIWTGVIPDSTVMSEAARQVL